MPAPETHDSGPLADRSPTVGAPTSSSGTTHARSCRLVAGALTVAWGVTMALTPLPQAPLTFGIFGAVVIVLIVVAQGRLLWPTVVPVGRADWLRSIGLGVGVGAVMVALTYPAYALAIDLFEPLAPEVTKSYAAIAVRPELGALLCLFSSVIAEELLFRGLFFRAFGNPKVAAGLGLIAYVAVQLGAGTWVVALLALVCGGIWTLQRWWSGNLVAPLLSHAIWTVTLLALHPLVPHAA